MSLLADLIPTVNAVPPNVPPERQVMRATRIVTSEPQRLLLRGELDAGTAVLGRRRLRAALQTGRGPLILDCSAVEFMDAAWLGVLVGIANYGRRIDRQVVVAAPSPRVARLLRLVGLQWLTANE